MALLYRFARCCKSCVQFQRPVGLLQIRPLLASTKCAPFVTESQQQNRVKRPVSTFLRFVMVNRTAIIKQNPGTKYTDRLKILGTMWNTMSADEKKPFSEAYEQEKLEYDKYEKSLSPEEKAEMKRERADKHEKKIKNRNKKLSIHHGRPKRPLTSYARFVKEYPWPRTSSIEKNQEIMKKVAEKWNSMSDEEKMPFQRAHKEEMRAHENNLACWEEEMIEAGLIKLVRVHSIPKELQTKKKKKVASKTGDKNEKTKQKKTDGDEKVAQKKQKKKVDEDPSWMREE